MHELGIAQSILESVRDQAPKLPGRPLSVGLRIGDVSGVDRDALTFGFQALVKGTDLEHLGLEVERVPYRRYCGTCGREFEAEEFDPTCPDCSNPNTEFRGGDELEIAYLEVEE